MSGTLTTERISMATTPEYADWLDDMATRAGMTKSAVIDVAVEEYAARRGLAAPPRRRLATWRRHRAARRPQGDS